LPCLVSASFIQQNKDFADDFAKSLSQFDELLLLDIYPARELPMEGITSEWLPK
jgi:UDP-N-acetylmuramate--alanine ligase